MWKRWNSRKHDKAYSCERLIHQSQVTIFYFIKFNFLWIEVPKFQGGCGGGGKNVAQVQAQITLLPG